MYRLTYQRLLMPFTLCLLFLLAACGSQATQGQADNANTPTTITTTIVQTAPPDTPTPMGETLPAMATSCPANGTARAAVMTPQVPGAHQALVYVYNQGSSEHPISSQVRRYDVTTGEKMDIVNIGNARISGAQLSTDGQWVIFNTVTAQGTELQMARVDGQELQTLYCTPATQTLGNALLSPDQKQLIFPITSGGNTPLQLLGVYLLNITSGKLQQVLGGQDLNTAPAMWLDNTHVYMSNPYIQMTLTTHHISLLDTTKGAQQKESDLQPAGTQPVCGDFDKSMDGTAFLFSRCSQQGESQINGPSTIATQPVQGGASHILYTNPTLGITVMRVISNTTLLLFVQNSTGDTSKNGIWKVNIDGSNAMLLAADDKTNTIEQIGARGASWASASRDSSMYCLESANTTKQPVTNSLAFGSLAGGALTTFASLPTDQGALKLVGWTTT